MKKRLWAIFLSICLVVTLLPTTALAAGPVLQGYCGGDANAEKVTWELVQNNEDSSNPTYTLTISGAGAMKNFTVNGQKDERPWKDYISSITKGIVTHGVTNVGDRTFYNCSKMASVELADGITSITGGAFENCTSLTSLTLPNSLEMFGGNAFKGCTGLTGELVIPDSVRVIKNWAFMNCTSISSVSIGKNVESISESAFEKCQSLKSITFKGKTKTIGPKAFRETSLMSLTLPDGLETIGADAFYGIATLSGMLVIPESVTKIEQEAFWTGRNNGNGPLSNISGIRVDSPKISIGNSAFRATGANYIDLTRVDELSSWGDWVLDENESCIIYAKSDSVLGKVKDSQHVTAYIYALTSGGIFAENTVFLQATLANPVKDGYAFTGWYKDEACTEAVTADDPAAGQTYYAKWEEAAASVNGVGYTTLGAAITAAQDSDTITLLKDVTENVTIPADKTITLDLNGNDITVNDGCAIVNKGTLTITGSGNVTTSANGSAAVANFPDAAVNLNGGTYSSSSWYVIKNMGGMVIDGPVTVKKPDGSTDTSSLIDNGWVNGSDTVASESVTAQANKAKLTIKNGAFEGKSGSASCSVVKNDDYGVLEITGGTFDSTNNVETSNATTILNWNVATISGGTFKGSYPISNGSYKNEADLGLLTISGGDFIGTSSLFGQAQGGTSGAGKVTITDGSFKAPQFGAFDYAVEISGGTFSFDPSTKVKNNGTDYIVKRAGSEGAYTYTVLAKSGLTSGVYLTDPSGALASNYYVSSTANGVWTVSYSAPYSGGSSSDPTYSVSTPSKTENGSVTVSPKNASKGTTVTINAKPDSGYVLETLTVTDKNGNELTLKDKGNGKYTFTMPAGKVEVKATFMEDNSMLNFFYDVPNNAYFYEAVKWAVENGITTGVGNDRFAPEQPCTRAQIVTFLWRAAGSPEPKGAASGMTDVVSGSYYEKAVAWAIENGITTGIGDGKFSPDATCTRAQAVTFLARALNAKATSAAEFSDVPTDSYFANAVAWAAANGVTEGVGGGLFGSDNDCTRGQIVTFLFRAYNK